VLDYRIGSDLGFSRNSNYQDVKDSQSSKNQNGSKQDDRKSVYCPQTESGKDLRDYQITGDGKSHFYDQWSDYRHHSQQPNDRYQNSLHQKQQPFHSHQSPANNVILRHEVEQQQATSVDPQQTGPNAYRKPALYKTRLCHKYMVSGWCKFGEHCHFAHGVNEMVGVAAVDTGRNGTTGNSIIEDPLALFARSGIWRPGSV
jgi:hypothetical protein